MARHENRPTGTDFARFFSLGSRVLKRVPFANQAIVGNNNIPSGWHVLGGQHACTIASYDAWIQFEGDPDASRLPIPRLAKVAGVVAMNSVAMNGLRGAHLEGLDAIAVRFGDDEAVVVGALKRQMRFNPTIEPGVQLVGTRIMRGDIQIMPGLLMGDVDSLSSKSHLEFLPATLVQFYARTPIKEVNAGVPLA